MLYSKQPLLKRCSQCVIVLVAFLISSRVDAGIVLTLDTNNESLTISGTDTGTPPSTGVTSWRSGRIGSGLQDLTISPAIQSTNDLGNDNLDTAFLSVWGNGVLEMGIFVTDKPVRTTTFSGTGTSVSYAGLDASNKVILEGFVGNSLPLFGSATGFDSVQVTAVPEPSTLAVLSLLTAVMLIGITIIRRLKLSVDGTT